MKKKLMSTEEAARYLSVSKWTLERWRREHDIKIPFLKIGRAVRYRLSDLANYIREVYIRS